MQNLRQDFDIPTRPVCYLKAKINKVGPTSVLNEKRDSKAQHFNCMTIHTWSPEVQMYGNVPVASLLIQRRNT